MKINIDFCIIKNPLENSKNNLLVFITKAGLMHLDESIKDEEGYKVVVNTLKEVGYLETDNFRFEYIKNISTEDSSEKDLKKLLQKAGASYSKGLEEAINEDFETIKSKLDINLINDLLNQSEENTFASTIDEAFYKLQTEEAVKSKDEDPDFKLPKLREKIDLNMYLFVDLFMLDDIDDFKADLNGGFIKTTKEHAGGGYKSLVKIFSDSFTRVNYNNNPEVIELVSTKSKGDLYKETTFLYDVIIDVIKASKFNDTKTMLETRPYFFNIQDLKDKFKLDEKIYFEVGVDDYRKMVTMSKNIELERVAKQQKNSIDIEEVLDDCYGIIESIEDEMLMHAEEEEFKEALSLKNRILKIKEKIESFKEYTSDKESVSLDDLHNLLSADI